MDKVNLNKVLNETLSPSKAMEEKITTAKIVCHFNTHCKTDNIKCVQIENEATMPYFLSTTVAEKNALCHELTELINTIKPEVNTNSDLKHYQPCDFGSHTMNSAKITEKFHKFIPFNSNPNHEIKDDLIETVSRCQNITEKTNSIIAVEYTKIGNENLFLRPMIGYFSSDLIVATEALSNTTSHNILQNFFDGQECGQGVTVKEIVKDEALEDTHNNITINNLNEVVHTQPNPLCTLTNANENSFFKCFYKFLRENKSIEVLEMDNYNSFECVTINKLNEVNDTNSNLLCDTLANSGENNYLNYCTFDNYNKDNGECDENVSVSSLSEHCSGYQSSDFEFIDENEAKTDVIDVKETVRMEDNKDFIDENNTNETIFHKQEISRYFNYYNQKHYLDFVGGTSSHNIFSNSTFRSNDLQRNYNYQKDHIIPEGDAYLNLFQGSNISTLELSFMENKSIFARNTPPSAANAIGFDINMLLDAHKQYETANDVEEAKKTEEQILAMYPQDNRNYRRRS